MCGCSLKYFAILVASFYQRISKESTTMKWIKIAYTTLWLRCHPITGPVSADDPTPALYPSWRGAWDVARGLG